MSARQDILHTGEITADLDIQFGNGILTLPAGTALTIVAVIHEGENLGGTAIAVRAPDVVIEYRIGLVADSIRVTGRS